MDGCGNRAAAVLCESGRDLGEEEAMALRFAEQIARMETGDFVANKRGTHRIYEAAGLSAMVDVGRDPYSRAEAAKAKEHHLRLIHEKGVKAAVRARDNSWDDELSQV